MAQRRAHFFIKALKKSILIGPESWAQTVPQTVFFDLEYSLDTAVRDAPHITDLSLKIDSIVEHTAWHSESELAEALSQKLIENFSFSRLKLSVSRNHPILNCQSSGVCLEQDGI